MAPAPRSARVGRLAPSRWATWPAVSYLIVVTQLPLLATLYFSVHSWNLLYPARPVRFVGLNNFIFIVSDAVFRTAIENTVIFTVVPAILTMLIGLGLALLVNRLDYGRGLAYSLLFAPFLIMETVNPDHLEDDDPQPDLRVAQFRADESRALSHRPYHQRSEGRRSSS